MADRKRSKEEMLLLAMQQKLLETGEKERCGEMCRAATEALIMRSLARAVSRRRFASA